MNASELIRNSSRAVGIVDRMARATVPDFPVPIEGPTEQLERVLFDMERMAQQSQLVRQAIREELVRREA